VRDEGRDVGRQEVLTVTKSDDERGVPPGCDHPVGDVGMHGDQGERTVEPTTHGSHRVGQVGTGSDVGREQV
jgi:hypothetical protein